MKSFLSRSAVIAGALLFGLIVFSAQPSIAETLFSPFQQKEAVQQNPQKEPVGPREVLRRAEAEDLVAGKAASPSTIAPESVASGKALEAESPIVSASNYVATAYSLRGKTASGRMVSRGIIAADPRVLPLGSRVRLEAAGYHGEYLVADTGGMIRGRRIDIWIPSSKEAMRFGRRTVKLTVLSYPAKRAKRGAKA
jgi:3D (Asp-Asp-Asp) domain-containing protein